ncbi:hypothetical protein BGZ61DRAFT_98576 [Ilyonectria robusta]|uniref:uncharacterized protein n=1 Tax=Ilyonectria robusta TaxID=1079257 RepID=UPI001E8D0309|nr:uncharacterized protein BGZ61DRAFT_98576 [Ilyonectria robusta]KAH8675004.1 hypothetical protein BGZ61DRAFT_98576 [Ilyonectria robusta]
MDNRTSAGSACLPHWPIPLPQRPPSMPPCHHTPSPCSISPAGMMALERPVPPRNTIAPVRVRHRGLHALRIVLEGEVAPVAPVAVRARPHGAHDAAVVVHVGVPHAHRPAGLRNRVAGLVLDVLARVFVAVFVRRAVTGAVAVLDDGRVVALGC